MVKERATVSRRGLLGSLCCLPFLGVFKAAPAKEEPYKPELNAAVELHLDRQTGKWVEGKAPPKLHHPLLGEIQSVRVTGTIDHGSWLEFGEQPRGEYYRYINFPIESTVTIVGSRGSAEFSGFNLTQETKDEIYKHRQDLLDHLTDICSPEEGVLGVNNHVKICGNSFMLSSYSLGA